MDMTGVVNSRKYDQLGYAGMGLNNIVYQKKR